MAPSIKRNALWTLFGQGAPLSAALVAVPPVLNTIGADRFGIVMLFWLTVGYFSLFDLGLGRATTQLIASHDRKAGSEELGTIVVTALVAMTLLGVLGGIVLAMTARLLVDQILNVPPGIRDDALAAFRTLSVALPAVTVSTGLRGVLEARDRFQEASFIRCAMGMFTFLGPLVLIHFEPTLFSIAILLVVTRWLTTLAHAPFVIRAMPELRRGRVVAREVGELLRFGGWITVSNVISPVMVNIDRFVIGAVLTVAAVGYYATPFEMITKAAILPGALVTALFPVFASAGGRGDGAAAHALLRRGLLSVFVMMFPIALLVVLFARPLLAVWLGADFADHSAQVLRVLAIGIVCNGLAYVPSAFVQAVGRPDLTAKVHLFELPFYLACLWLLAKHGGIEGVALAWTMRVTLDLVLLCIVSRTAHTAQYRWGRPVVGFVVGVGALTIGTVWHSLIAQLVATALGITIASLAARALLAPARGSASYPSASAQRRE